MLIHRENIHLFIILSFLLKKGRHHCRCFQLRYDLFSIFSREDKNLYFDTVSKYLSEEADKSDLIIKIIMIEG